MQVAFGNSGEASLRQSLRVNLSGEIAEGVELLAVLTDQNLPLQPEGSTRELRDLDQVLFSMFSASLGRYGRHRTFENF